MKRIIVCALVAAAAGGILFAQDNSSPSGRRAPPAKTTLSGTLSLSRGSIALESGGSTYYVMGIDRLVGFIDGLKEGAAVSLEGWAFPLPRSENEQIFRAEKLTLNGKEYELGPRNGPALTRNEFRPGSGPGNFGQRPGLGQRPGSGPGREGFGQRQDFRGPGSGSHCNPRQAPSDRGRKGRR